MCGQRLAEKTGAHSHLKTGVLQDIGRHARVGQDKFQEFRRIAILTAWASGPVARLGIPWRAVFLGGFGKSAEAVVRKDPTTATLAYFQQDVQSRKGDERAAAPNATLHNV